MLKKSVHCAIKEGLFRAQRTTKMDVSDVEKHKRNWFA